MRTLETRSDDTLCVQCVPVQQTQFQKELLNEVLTSYLALKSAREELRRIVQEAHDEGISYRQMAEVTGYSHEYFRKVLLRAPR